MFGTLLESLSWCQPLLESLSWYKPGVRLPPRVTIVVQTVGLADWVSLPNPHSCRYRGTNPGFDVLLELLSWCQPLLESLSWCQPLLESLSWCQPLLVSLSWFNPVV